MTSSIAVSILQVFGIAAVGWVARHLGHIRDEEDVNRWGRLVLDFLMPALFFDSITNNLEGAATEDIPLLFGICSEQAEDEILLPQGSTTGKPQLLG